MQLFYLKPRLINAEYTAFDIWDRPYYENQALNWVRSRFRNRSIRIIKGDSTSSVPSYDVIKSWI